MVFTIFDMKQLRKINPHGTDVKTNEDMYPLSRDFFFLSFLLFFFYIAAKSQGLFGGGQAHVNVFRIS